MSRLTRREFAAHAAASALAPSPLFVQSSPGSYPDRPVKMIVPLRRRSLLILRAAFPWRKCRRGKHGRCWRHDWRSCRLARQAGRLYDPAGRRWGGPHVINPIAARKISCDRKKDVDPITVTTINGLGATVHSSVLVRNLKELIDYLKKNPGTMSYASADTGSATHLGAELFKQFTGISDLPHVPYKGGAALVDLVSGQVKLSFLNINGQILPQYQRTDFGAAQ